MRLIRSCWIPTTSWVSRWKSKRHWQVWLWFAISVILGAYINTNLFGIGRMYRDRLMEAEMASYHGPGTCTFYGTANSNQMLMEFMGLHLPGASFVNPGTPLRDALTDEAA